MKTIDAALLATYQSPGPTIVCCVTVTRTDLVVFRWVGHDRDLPIGGFTYKAAPGVQMSSLVSTEGFGVDNAEVTVLEYADITRAAILAGVWDGAAFELAEVDWKAAVPVKHVLKKGTLGNWKAKRGHSTVEFRDLRQVIQGSHETVLQPTCRYQLGDAKCTKDISGAPFTVSGTVDSSSSQYNVTDAARTEAADYFGDGTFTFDAGPSGGLNAGLSQKIKTFSAGVFVFWQQFVYPIGNDNYTAVAGCHFRFQEDCITKFGNGVNFGGEPNKRNPDTLTAPA